VDGGAGRSPLATIQTNPGLPLKFTHNATSTLVEHYHQKQALPSLRIDEVDQSSDSDWDEGRTLIDGVKDLLADPKEQDLAKSMACVDELQVPMTEEAKKLQQELIEALVPAMDHIRLVHGLLEDSVEGKLTHALAECDHLADDYQAGVADRMNRLQEMLEDSKKVLGKQFVLLRDEYANRKQLLADFQADFEEMGTSGES